MVRHSCVVPLLVTVFTAYFLKLFFNQVGNNSKKLVPQKKDESISHQGIKAELSEEKNSNLAINSQEPKKSIDEPEVPSKKQNSRIAKLGKISNRNSTKKNLHDKLPTSSSTLYPALKSIDYSQDFSSSIWCDGTHHTNRMCKFSNICFSPVLDNFLVFHSNRSVIHGVPADRFNPALLDGSSVSDHNALYFNYVDVPVEDAHHFLHSVSFITHTVFLLNRLNGGNLMHVFHDELLPYYFTLLKNFGENFRKLFEVQPVFLDIQDSTEYVELYGAFSKHKPIYKVDMLKANRTVCFKDAHVGLTKNTVWYQYGFLKPSSPVDNPLLTGDDIRRFNRVILTSLIPSSDYKFKNYILLLTRRHNRLILNEAELIVAIASEFNMKVFSASLTTHSLTDIIQLSSGASGIIGMHGSLLIMAMFLPKGAFVLELYPYGINPENYTPYKSLVSLHGMEINYRAWRNVDESSTVTHPEYEREQGGIKHLPSSVQKQIMEEKSVAPHLCCSDESWLFRIYQDTIVNIVEVLQHLSILQQLNKVYVANNRLYPSLVTNIICKVNHSKSDVQFDLSWSKPVNTDYLNFTELRYEVWLQVEGVEHYKSAYTMGTSGHFSGLLPHKTYNIWIRCIVDEKRGEFNKSFQCTT